MTNEDPFDLLTPASVKQAVEKKPQAKVITDPDLIDPIEDLEARKQDEAKWHSVENDFFFQSVGTIRLF